MPTDNDPKTIALPPDGPLALNFTLHYKDGSSDHSRNGRKFKAVRLPDGAEYGEYALREPGVPGISYTNEHFRTSPKHQESRGTLTIDQTAPLPLTILVDEINEYHPDYYNEQGLSWEERSPTIENKVVEMVVVGEGGEGAGRADES
jgi:hypothetical protein